MDLENGELDSYLGAAQYFPNSYQEGRSNFINATSEFGARLTSYALSAEGCKARHLSCDVASFGPAGAQNVLVVNTGIHGVEGYAGSGVLTSWLTRFAGQKPLEDVRCVFIHALNPYGFQFDRRFNEDNVDLNRNFVSLEDREDNTEYANLHEYLVPAIWNQQSASECVAQLESYKSAHGDLALANATEKGQHSHTDGLNYAGNGPVWSHRTFLRIVDELIRPAQNVAFLDIHTGSGIYGSAEIMHIAEPDSLLWHRLKRWYHGGLTSPLDGSATFSVAPYGNLDVAIYDLLPEAEVTSVCLEFGTYPWEQIRPIVYEENWHFVHGDRSSERARQISAKMREAFSPTDGQWQDLVALRSWQCMGRAMSGLSD